MEGAHQPTGDDMSKDLSKSGDLVCAMYEVADDFGLTILGQLLEAAGYQQDCECGSLIYYDTKHCNSCGQQWEEEGS
jgi:hypothetical protein